MITDADIQKLKEVFATKDTFTELRTELKNDILNFKDAILYEIIKLREDVAITTGYRDMIEDHDVRIGVIETKFKIRAS